MHPGNRLRAGYAGCSCCARPSDTAGLGLVAARQEEPERAVTLLTFATEHPLLLSAFTLGEPERVLEDMSKDLPVDVFARAEARWQTRDVGRIM
jgi:hypothetical protein